MNQTSKQLILCVDDEEQNLTLLKRFLGKHYDVVTSTKPLEAVDMYLSNPDIDVVLTDQRMPDLTGVELLKRTVTNRSDKAGILLTAYTDHEALADGVNAEVIYRYLQKPIIEQDLLNSVLHAFEKVRLVRENRRAYQQLQTVNRILDYDLSQKDSYCFSSDHPAMVNAIQKLTKVASSNSTVLLRGESGTGKEVFARMLHMQSPRADKPFVKVNCGAISETLLESELFGHEKGAFTGAAQQRIGRFEAADGGTLFLDEIGDISAKLQVSLLRALQEKTFERIGSSKSISVDIRLVAATHQNLEDLIAQGKFREDLFYRLNVFPLHIPPLRDRLADLTKLIPTLTQKAAIRAQIKAKDLSVSAMQKMQSYDWPGNVRELENVLERALILSSGTLIEEDDICLGDGFDPISSSVKTKDLDKEDIIEALAKANGNKVEAARALGIKRPTLYYHMRRFSLLPS